MVVVGGSIAVCCAFRLDPEQVRLRSPCAVFALQARQKPCKTTQHVTSLPDNNRLVLELATSIASMWQGIGDFFVPGLGYGRQKASFYTLIPD